MDRMIAREINGERLVLLGWPCAILMQLAHPLIAAGVSEHSTFRQDRLAPVRRLHATVRAMLGLTFGSREEQADVIARILAVHVRVNGRLRTAVGPYAAGTPYSAEDPALVLWVHATMLDTTVRVYERTVRPLGDTERDAYCEESAPIAIALGAQAGSVPRRWSELLAIVEAALAGQLAVGPDAREVSYAMLHGGPMPMLGPVGWATRHLTAAWLPSPLRAQYGIEWTARDQARAERLEALLRFSRRGLPRPVARWHPKAHRPTSASTSGMRTM